jgi:hypothetical protein
MSTVGRPISTNTFGMVFSTTWLESKDMVQDWHAVLFEYGTGCEWHPSNQTLQCPVVTIICYSWSVGSWQVFHIVGLTGHPTSNWRDETQG